MGGYTLDKNSGLPLLKGRWGKWMVAVCLVCSWGGTQPYNTENGVLGWGILHFQPRDLKQYISSVMVLLPNEPTLLCRWIHQDE